VDDVGGHLLGPSVAAVRLTGDKLRLARLWTDQGVATPPTHLAGELARRGDDVHDEQARRLNMLVCKPRFGAGSQATFVIARRDQVEVTLAQAQAELPRAEFLLQAYVPGQPASVAFLTGPRETVPLVPAFQHISTDGRLKYLGGRLPMPPSLAARAVRLATRAISVVPGLRGYVGVDLMLGDDVTGSADYAIEVNPRLTTSYLGLRRLAQFNLAEKVLQIASGQESQPLRWKRDEVIFGVG
jgi:predicted ATP-grasp superfamily ATP-dependent carboligase